MGSCLCRPIVGSAVFVVWNFGHRFDPGSGERGFCYFAVVPDPELVHHGVVRAIVTSGILAFEIGILI